MRLKKIAYTTSAMLMALSLASCNRVPKAPCVREIEQCTTMTETTSTTATTELRTTTTTTMTSATTETETTTTEAEVATEAETEPLTEVSCEADRIYIEPLSGFEGVWYCATDMGYSSNPCGASGNQLVPGFSVASDYFPFGTVLYVESEYMSGTFRVDDCGVGVSNVLDFYFYDRSQIPEGFAQAGRIPISITIIE